jgi:hypothetical protein
MTEEKDSVGSPHPDYWQIYQRREIYSDVCSGTLTLRAKHKKYLPQFPAETEDDYTFRWQTASLFNLTQKTRNMMTGLVFKETIRLESDVASDLVELWEDIDNAGTHGDVFCQRLFEDSFEGYSIILVDAPVMTAQSRADQKQLGLRPYWVQYKADDVWNWQWQINPVSKRKELSLIVLKEVTMESAGEFQSENVIRFRVFRLVDGLVTWSLVREQQSSDGSQIEYVEEGAGVLPQLTQIPIAVVSELGNDPFLLDITLKNIEHFQTYSDYKTLIHKTCVPIPVGKGVELAGSEKIVVGGSTMVLTSADGGFGFAEVSGSSLEVVRQSLQDNRDDIALMGLTLLADKTSKVDMTATEALLNNVAETSELRMFARQLQDAIELALGHTAEYLQLPREQGGSVKLGTAWAGQKDGFKMSLDEFGKRLELVNKAQGILPIRWQLEFLGVTNEDELEEMIRQLREDDVILVEERQPEALPPAPDEEAPEEEEDDDLALVAVDVDRP